MCRCDKCACVCACLYLDACICLTNTHRYPQPLYLEYIPMDTTFPPWHPNDITIHTHHIDNTTLTYDVMVPVVVDKFVTVGVLRDIVAEKMGVKPEVRG